MVDVFASYLETFVFPTPPASVIDDHMGAGFTDGCDDVAEAVEAFLSEHPNWVTDNHTPISRELDDFDIECVETVNTGLAAGERLKLAEKPEAASDLVTVEMLVQYQQSYCLRRITKAMVVDAGIDWEPGAGDDAIQEYLDQNWDDHKAEARLLTSDFCEVSFQDVAGFDPTTIGEKKLFTFKAVCTALRDYTATHPKPHKVKAGEQRTLNGRIFSGASNGPPVHPRCRCIALPVSTG